MIKRGSKWRATYAKSAKAQYPNWNSRLGSLERAGLPDLVDGGIRSDGVGDVVGTVGERGGTGSHDLNKSKQVLGLVVVVRNVGVDGRKISSENGLLLGLHVDDVLVDTAEEEPLDIPEQNLGLTPLAVGLGANELLLLGHLNVAGDGVDGGGVVRVVAGVLVVGGLLADVCGLDIISARSVITVAEIVELLAGHVAGVEVTDTTRSTVGLDRGLGTLQQERAHGNVPPAELPVVLDDNAIQPGNEEDGDKESPGGTDTNNHTGSLSIVEGDLDGTTLPDDKHSKEGSGETKVDGDKEQTLEGRVGSEHDGVLGDQEDDDGEGSRDTGGDDPGQEDGDDTGADLTTVEVGPDDVVGTDKRNTHTNDTTHDGVSGGNSETHAGAEGEPGSGTDDGAHHTEHKKRGVVLEGVDVDDLGTDGISDTGTDTDGTGEFEDRTESHGLDVPDGSGRDRGGPGVGNIVGTYDDDDLLVGDIFARRDAARRGKRTNVPGIKEREDGADGEDVVELVERHSDGWRKSARG
jgi:hypothetical protein